MNIVYLCRNFYKDRGGIETYVREIARFMGRRGHTVHIIAEDNGEFYREPFAPNVHTYALKMRARPFPGYWRISELFPLEDIRFARLAARKIKELKAEYDLDVIETMDYYRQGSCLMFNLKVPVVLRLHGWVFNRQEGRVNPVGSLNFKEKLWWHMQQRSLDAADVISAVSKDFAAYASEIWRIDPKKVRVTSNAVDSETYRPLLGNFRQPAVIFAARLAKIKGVKTLADAIPLVLADFPDAKFYFAGKDIYWNEEGVTAVTYIASKAPSKNIIFLGEVSSHEIISYYQNCAVCALPSLYEPFGITALEAMACGCALVASRSGGLQEIVSHEKDGLLVAPGDPDALAAAIKRFLADDQLRERCTNNAVAKMTTQYTYENIVDEMTSAYNDAIAHFSGKK